MVDKNRSLEVDQCSFCVGIRKVEDLRGQEMFLCI